MVSYKAYRSINGLVDRVSATETVDLSSIPSRVKDYKNRYGIQSFVD